MDEKRQSIESAAWELNPEHLFNAIDINSDGNLTKEELCDHMVERGIGKREARLLFDLLDSSGDGEVGASDLASLFIAMIQ